MANLDVLITLLASQFKDTPHLRDALIQTMLSVLAKEQSPQATPPAVPNYFDLLRQIRAQQVQAIEAGQQHTERALHELGETIREELQHTALTIHTALRAGQFKLDEVLVQRVGIAVNNFPVGFPQDINLLQTSVRYLQLTRDLNLLHHYFPQQRFNVSQTIIHEKHQVVRWLQDVALEALASSNDVELIKLHRQCRAILQNHRIEAENNLLAILKESDPPHRSQQIRQMEVWLQKYGSLGRDILKNLSTVKHQKTLLFLLVCTRDYTGLEALSEIEIVRKEEREFFEVLMLVRFGPEYQQAAHAWKTWLRKRIDKGIHKPQAIAFWKTHSAALPVLLAETMSLTGWEGLEIPESLHTVYHDAVGRTPVPSFLERWGSSLSREEVERLERIPSTPRAAPPPLPMETTFSLDEVRLEEEPPFFVPRLEIGNKEKVQPEHKENILPSPVLEGAVEAAVDAAIEGNLGESALISILDKGSEVLGEQFVVTVKDDEEPPPHSSQRTKSLPPPSEPEERLWSDHLFPFIRANLVFVLSPSLIFVGLLLLVLTLWDQAAWIRYGVTPWMIVGVSYALTRIGLWLKGEDIPSDSPIVIIQSVSILLAPLSLLFVALLSVDAQLTLAVRVLWGAFLSVALLAAWWYIFTLAINTISRKTAAIHSHTLLLLNALLLLLPVAQFLAPSGDVGGHTGAKTILIAGFYLGFSALFWSMRRVLAGMATVDASLSRVPMIFYSATCLGTFVLVWGLTHARLVILPHPYTYGPLLLLLSILSLMSEFTLLDVRGQQGRITALSYAAYFCIGLGVLLSIGHDYVRVVALLLAGMVWFYQAVKLQDHRHFHIAMVILTLAFSVIALVQDFPPPFFPYLTLLVIAAIYLVSLIVPYKEAAMLAARLTPVYMSFAFVTSVLWQWADNINPFGYGVAFVIFGLFSMYLGAKVDKLVHVHAGAAYLVAALPYLGAMDMKLYTLEGNTLVFGLGLVGIFWGIMSSTVRNPAIRDSRSTVLWNIGILAFCMMVLRVFLGETLDFSSNPILQFQILSGPILIAGLMFLAGYFTKSYVPVYLALIVLVIIFPEIKDRFNIPMYSGLGSTVSGLGFLILVFLLGRWPLLRKRRQGDLIWRRKSFPFRARSGVLLYANPLVVAAFFLFTRTIFVTYPQNVFRPLMPFSLRTCLAVVLSGTAYHFFSVWFKKSWFSYIGFLAIWIGIVHSAYVSAAPVFDEAFVPLFMLFAFLYCAAIPVISATILPDSLSLLIIRPYTHVRAASLWLFALSFYLLYTGYYATLILRTSGSFIYWLPLAVYLWGTAAWLGWHSSSAKRSWFFWVPAYLLFWQFVILSVSRGTPLPDVLGLLSSFILTTSVMVLGITASFFFLEPLVTKKQFRSLSPLLWLSCALLLLFSPIVVLVFYGAPTLFSHLLFQLSVWALVSLILGRFLNLGQLWLWSVFLIHLLFLPALGGPSRFYASFHPLMLACIALFLAGLSNLFAIVTGLFEHKYSWPWVKKPFFSPSFLFAVVSHLVVVSVFVLGFSTEYRHEWLTVFGLFLAALPALFAAHQLGLSRHFLFGVPYSLAWIALMLALRIHFPANGWLEYLSTFQIIAIGLFGAIVTAGLSETILACDDPAYHLLKTLVAAGILVLIVVTYLSLRNIELLSWQWLATSGILALGAALILPQRTQRGAEK